MTRSAFERRGEPSWQELEVLLRKLERIGARRVPAGEWAALPRLFRRLCQDLALARHRHYSSKLVQRLNGIALRAHQHMYKVSHRTWARFWQFVGREFPRSVRQERWLVLWACLLFFVPLLGMALTIQERPDLAYSVMPASQIARLEEMYQPGEEHASPSRDFDRLGDSDFMMFGFYVWNNIGIAFKTYAGGVLYGVGAILILFFNGFVLGAAFGHINYIGAGTALNSFAIGHGAFELTGIALAGAAGLRLGMALIAPGRRGRGHAFRVAGAQSFKIIAGAGLMLLVAAFIEAYWSPRRIPPNTKYLVGLGLWVVVFLYLGLAGRSGARRRNGS